MYEIAFYNIVVVCIILFIGIITSLLSYRFQNYSYLKSSYNCLTSSFILVSVSVLILIRGFIADDFSLEYVVMHSSRGMPLMYKVAALWGGQEGSILFWIWVLLLYGLIMSLIHRRKNIELMPVVNIVFYITAIFFISILMFVANPFKLMDGEINDGRGLNPLLQDPGMVFHPPALYFGFIGFTIPFAYAVSSLVMNKLDITWVKVTRGWALLSWLFLNIGIVLGAKWAYIELGWGGYWAWDPIENSSLIPWFTSTAYIHSVMVQERKNMLRLWNLSLMIITFWLCILGTFLTRSGVISSVHAFAESSIGDFFIIFLALIFLFSFSLIYLRWDKMREGQKIESLLSKENSFILNNVILIVMAIIVLWGTTLPIFSEIFTGKQIAVPQRFYNNALMPFSFVLLILTGICIFLAWGRTQANRVLKVLSFSAASSFIIVIILYILGIRLWSAILLIYGSAFILISVLIEFIKGIKARRNIKKEMVLVALVKLILKNRRKYIGYIVHFAVAMIFVGLIGSYYNQQKEIILTKGSTINFKDYEIKYAALRTDRTENKTSVIAELQVKQRNNVDRKLFPSIGYYELWEEPMSEVDILSTFRGDLYAVLVGWQEDDTAIFKFFFNPLIQWLWNGCWLLIGSTVILLLPEKLFYKRIK